MKAPPDGQARVSESLLENWLKMIPSGVEAGSTFPICWTAIISCGRVWRAEAYQPRMNANKREYNYSRSFAFIRGSCSEQSVPIPIWVA